MDDPSHNVKSEPIIHIGNLSFKTTVNELQQLFSIVVDPKNITICNKNVGSSTFGFVTFGSIEDCENIIDKFDFYSLHNKQINLVMYNENKKFIPEANIFVKNLPPNLNSKDLNEIFKMFGKIVSCKVASDKDGNLKGYGFVQYNNTKSAKRAMAKCQNVKIGNNLLEVEIYKSNLQDNKSGGVDRFTNCYIKNFPNTITEKKLRAVLEKYGEVTSLFFPVKEDGTPVGHGCANFSRHEDAITAINELNGKYVFKEEGSETAFYIQKWESKKERSDIINKMSDMGVVKGQRCKDNLYVSNIPVNFSDEDIVNIFSKFGNIYDYRIFNSTIGKEMKYGYICYYTPEEAAVAFERIDGTYLDGSKLQVSFYKNKEERELEKTKGRTAGKREIVNEGRGMTSEDIGIDVANGVSKKHIQGLYDKLILKADEWSDKWDSIKVKNSNDFAVTITLSITRSPYFTVEELFTHDDLLNTYIEKFINEKGRFMQSSPSNTSNKLFSENKIND